MKQKATHTTNSTKEIFPFSLEKTITKSSGINFLYVKDNHLGNVMSVISDRKIARDINQDNTVDYYNLMYY
ncbi:MAG: hypothetical protein KFKLKKLM_01343 [Flavobacteriales bacterium]|nr:hypothetical protein [Flavobacteriales bacterium]